MNEATRQYKQQAGDAAPEKDSEQRFAYVFVQYKPEIDRKKYWTHDELKKQAATIETRWKIIQKKRNEKKTTHTHTHTHMEETLKHQNNNNHNYKQQDARIRELLLYRCGIFIHIAFAANLLTCVCWTDIEWRMHVYAMHSYQRKPYVMCTLAIVRCLFRISPHSQVLDILLEQRILQCIAAYLCALHGFKSPQMQRIYQVQRHTCTTFFSMDWLFVYV